jgi:uracil-DNA glycosylase
VRCVPPENKPTPQETNTCNRFLKEEIAAMPNLKVILTLGQISHNAVLKALGQKASAHKFGHAAEHHFEYTAQGAARLVSAKRSKDGSVGFGAVTATTKIIVLNSYHTSRYNVNTNRLTFQMFDAIMEQAKCLLNAR